MSLPKRILICGGRQFDDHLLLNRTLSDLAKERRWSTTTTIIHGDALGADTLAKTWGKFHECEVQSFPPTNYNIRKWGMAIALLMRNQEMLDEGKPDLIVAFPGGRGTADMVDRGRRAGVEVIEV